MKNFSYILRLCLTLLIITAVMAAALAGVNAITEDKIAAAKLEKTQKAIAEVMPYHGDGEATEIGFTDDTGLVKKVYHSPGYLGTCLVGPDTKLICDFAVEVAPSGFDGEITMMVGVNFYGSVTGISIISHTETAGLGAVAAADSEKGEAFRNQFLGLGGQLAVSKDGGEIDALTGATITSRAIVEGVNAAVACVENLVKEAGQ